MHIFGITFQRILKRYPTKHEANVIMWSLQVRYVEQSKVERGVELVFDVFQSIPLLCKTVINLPEGDMKHANLGQGLGCYVSYHPQVGL